MSQRDDGWGSWGEGNTEQDCDANEGGRCPQQAPAVDDTTPKEANEQVDQREGGVMVVDLQQDGHGTVQGDDERNGGTPTDNIGATPSTICGAPDEWQVTRVASRQQEWKNEKTKAGEMK